jgi:hypothetical protein
MLFFDHDLRSTARSICDVALSRFKSNDSSSFLILSFHSKVIQRLSRIWVFEILVFLPCLSYPSTQLDPLTENGLEVDQRSRTIAGSSTRKTFKTIVEFCNGNFSLVVELMPTVDLLTENYRRSMWIPEP